MFKNPVFQNKPIWGRYFCIFDGFQQIIKGFAEMLSLRGMWNKVKNSRYKGSVTGV